MRYLLLLTLYLAASCTPCYADQNDDARAALALALASSASPKPAEPPAIMTYEVARAQAIRDNKPLVAFVRQPIVDVPGCVCVASDGFADDKGEQYILVGEPDGHGDVDQVGFFHHADAKEIKACLSSAKATRPAGAPCTCGPDCQCPGSKGGVCDCDSERRLRVYPPLSVAPFPQRSFPTMFTPVCRT